MKNSIRLDGLVTALGFLGVLATLAGFLGEVSWVLDLFTHLRFHLALGLIAVAAWCAWRHLWRWTVLFALCGLIHTAWVVPWFIGRPTAEAGGDTFTLLLLNVNTTTGDPAKVGRLIREGRPDVVVLQEISSRWVDELKPSLTRFPHQVVRPRNDNFGIGVFSRFPLLNAGIRMYGDVPSILADMRMDSGALRLIATHPLPPIGRDYWRSRNRHLEELPAWTGRASGVILAGDLNLTPWTRRYRRLLDRTGLTSAKRGRGLLGTWPDLPALFRIPLDHVLHSENVEVVDYRVGSSTSSDHRPVWVTFRYTDI